MENILRSLKCRKELKKAKLLKSKLKKSKILSKNRKKLKGKHSLTEAIKDFKERVEEEEAIEEELVLD